MINLCFSSLFKILDKAKRYHNQSELYTAMISLFYDGFIDSDKGTLGKYVKGDNLPNEIRINLKVKKPNYDSLLLKCENELVFNLKKSCFTHIVAAIKYILVNDTSLPSGTPIGFIHTFNKKKIIEANNFSMSELLTNCIYYCLEIENTDQSKNINKDFFSKPEIVEYANSITFNEDFSKVINSKLEFTCINSSFDTTFHNVNYPSALGVSKSSKINLYTLTFKDKNFSLEELIDLLNDNLSCYTFSRLENSTTEKSAIKQFKNAIKRVKAYYSKDNLDELIDNMLVYLFLENSLGAPKIFSNLELDKTLYPFNPRIESGIHFLNTSNDKQLVYSIANITENLDDAVYKILNKISYIVKSGFDSVKSIDRCALKCSFDEGTIEYLIEKILPSENSNSLPDTSFGICIGYSIDRNELLKLDSTNFKISIEDKFKNDAKGIIERLTTFILNDTNLKLYSYYIYLIPLFDVKRTKEIILKEIGG